jgi:hypothetical protein
VLCYPSSPLLIVQFAILGPSCASGGASRTSWNRLEVNLHL